jgi:serine/threonine protein kinase
MSKADMVRQGQVQHIRAERDVLALADNPWVVKLHFSFQDSVNLHLVMEYLPGGDLMSILMKYDILSHEVTKFYMAELALAVHSVHQLNYFHRDLKPDNVLVDSTGHIKLSDFGLCKAMDSPVPYNEPEPSEEAQDDFKNQHETASKRKAWQARSRALSYSVVGTPEYIAPEVFAKRGYDEKCDWWSLGVIMYECLIGYPPFYADTPRATVWKIVNWKRSLKFPDDVALSADAKDCILRLICSPSHRMTFEELQVHPFFAGIDWNSMRRAEAPIIPKYSVISYCC